MNILVDKNAKAVVDCSPAQAGVQLQPRLCSPACAGEQQRD
jgi:hypothetical protein